MDENYFMAEALKEAEIAYSEDEVPIGAVVVKDGQIIGRGHNMSERLKDPTAHAEMIAIREALKFVGGWRLINCEIYVTMEPCAMCAGAIVLSRFEKLYIGTLDQKSGAACSLYEITNDHRLNHQVNTTYGILQNQCKDIVQRFFKEKRLKGKETK